MEEERTVQKGHPLATPLRLRRLVEPMGRTSPGGPSADRVVEARPSSQVGRPTVASSRLRRPVWLGGRSKAKEGRAREAPPLALGLQARRLSKVNVARCPRCRSRPPRLAAAAGAKPGKAAERAHGRGWRHDPSSLGLLPQPPRCAGQSGRGKTKGGLGEGGEPRALLGGSGRPQAPGAMWRWFRAQRSMTAAFSASAPPPPHLASTEGKWDGAILRPACL